jgi:hypothetical protein
MLPRLEAAVAMDNIQIVQRAARGGQLLRRRQVNGGVDGSTRRRVSRPVPP